MTQMRKQNWKRLRTERPCRFCSEDHETGWCRHHVTRNNEGPAVAPPPRTMPPTVFLSVLFPNRTSASAPPKPVHQHARAYDVDGNLLLDGWVAKTTTKGVFITDRDAQNRSCSEWFPFARVVIGNSLPEDAPAP